MKKILVGLLALGSFTAFSQDYSLGCGRINTFEVDKLLAEQGIHGIYKLELEISKGVFASSYVQDAELIKKIASLKSSSQRLCVDTSYNADLESSFVSVVDVEI